MPVITACPDCSRKLRVPDELRGKKVRCPGCKLIFTARGDGDAGSGEAAAAPPRRSAAREDLIEQPPPRRPQPAPEEKREQGRAAEKNQLDEEELPRGRRLHEDDEWGDENVAGPRSDRAAWQKVSLGLVFVLISIAVGIVLPLMAAGSGMVIGAVAVSSNSSGPGPGPNPFVRSGTRTSFLVLSVLVTLLQTANAGLKCYGHYLGTSVPDKPGTRLKMWSLATFGLFAAWTALSTSAGVVDIATGVGNSLSVNPFSNFSGAASTLPMMIAAGFNLIGILSYMAGFVIFILYLRAVATAVRHRDLANTLKIFLICVCSVTAVLLVMATIAVAVLGFTFLSSSSPGPAAGPAPGQINAALGGVMATGGLFCLGFLAYCGLGIWYIILVIQVRFAVADYARPG